MSCNFFSLGTPLAKKLIFYGGKIFKLKVVEMNNKKLLNDGVMNFFFKKEECRSLSNFWGSVVVIKDEDERREYSNGESCFHGEKFIRVGKLCTDENRKRDLLEYGRRFMSVMDPSIAKKMGRKFMSN